VSWHLNIDDNGQLVGDDDFIEGFWLLVAPSIDQNWSWSKIRQLIKLVGGGAQWSQKQENAKKLR